MTDKKYELLQDDTITIEGLTLYRIRALRNFNGVIAGELGGYIEHERNLSHDGNCWLYDNAKAYDCARVTDGARLYDNSQASGSAFISTRAMMQGNSVAKGNTIIRGTVNISGNSIIDECAVLYDHVIVRGNSVVCGDTWLHGNCVIDDGYVPNGDAVVWFSNVGNERGTLTVYCGRTELLATRGCFTDTLDVFCIMNANRPFSMNSTRFTREYELLVEMARLRLSESQEAILRSAEK